PVRRIVRGLAAGEGTSPLRGNEAEERAQRRRLADAVAPEERGHGALGHVEADALQHVRAAEANVQVAHLEQGHQRVSPTYASWTVASRITAAGVSQARSRPWYMTAMRSARPVTTTMWCSTIRTVLPSSAWTVRIRSTSSWTFSTETPAIGSSSRNTRGAPARRLASPR